VKVGDVVHSPAGWGLVESIDWVLAERVRVTVELPDGHEELRDFYRDELEVAIPAVVEDDDDA